MSIGPVVLPPLDIDGPDFGLEDQRDLHTVLARLRRSKAYAVVPFASTKAVLLLTHELVSAAFRDEETFPMRAFHEIATKPLLGHSILTMTGQQHRVNRSIASSPLRRNKVQSYSGAVIQPVLDELIDRFAGRGSADLVAEFCQRFSLLINNRMLGIPITDEHLFYTWSHGMLHWMFDVERGMRCARELTEYVTPLVAERRANPGDDLISHIVTATAEDGEQLSDEEVLTFIRVLYPIGADTTMLAMSVVLSALLTHPEQLELVRTDPKEHAEWAVWEALRWEPPVSLMPRACPNAVRWNGIDIPAQTPMIFAIGAANRDPAIYLDPDVFDVTRKSKPIVSFGQGPHSCIGNWLAIAEMTHALTTLLTRLPELRLAPGTDLEQVRVRSQIGTAVRGASTLPVVFTAQ
ncbi:cytochrome P450 [Mycobacterium sp. CBMA271]|uniref:cytochrome P450 n=1 Tax=unclassified Mycobacteroides TaxID=2618759 RepID=UPI0012DDCB38|nr:MULTISPECIES: cytochrome P450 [unclassified Mycobacteroides]MUM19601.1 cytochrome [Mycobacteroides sp. CBMA 326]MUM24203.1 cytochrome P450 [Mycobacteroides sp. CBMA 271]